MLATHYEFALLFVKQFQACMAVAAIRTDEVPVCVGDRDFLYFVMSS